MQKKLTYLHPALYVAVVKDRGRGVFTAEALAAQTVVERAPVIVMNAEARPLLDKTLLHDYIFEWGENGKSCGMALGYVSLYNHLYTSNCEYEMNFRKAIITVRTVRDIAAGEELFINYNGDWNNEKKVWFDVI
jgi:SET domain-containing protein